MTTLTLEQRVEAAEHALSSFSYLEDINCIDDFDCPITLEQIPENENETDTEKNSVEENYYHQMFYRKLTNFAIYDVFAYRFKDFFRNERDPSELFLITGDLVSSVTAKLNRTAPVKVVITDMFYNFGVEYESDLDGRNLLKADRTLQAGFWVRDVEGFLYQLINPAESYQQIYDACTGAWGSASLFCPKEVKFGRKVHFIDNYSVINRQENQVNPLNNRNKDVLFLLGHILFLDSRESITRRLSVRIPFVEWELSLSNDDDPFYSYNHGFLAMNLKGNLWFNLRNPLEAYKRFYPLESLLSPNNDFLSSFTKPNRFYRGQTRRLTHFQMFNSDGIMLNRIPSRPDDQNMNILYAVIGDLCQPKQDLSKENQDIFRIRVFVTDFIVDMGYKEEEEVSVVAVSLDRIFYRIEWSDRSSFPEFNSILDCFNWPSEEGQVWRRIDNYCLTDLKGQSISLISKNSRTNRTILTGEIFPPPESSGAFEELRVQVYCEGYSIDFGENPEDDNRGLWLRDNHGNWFKLLSHPVESYSRVAAKGIGMTNKFLEFYQILVYSENPVFSDFDGQEQFFCPYSVQDIFQLSNGGFDLQFIAENKDFVIDNIDNVINHQKSKKFYRSIKDLSASSAAEYCKNLVIAKKDQGVEGKAVIEEKLPPKTTASKSQENMKEKEMSSVNVVMDTEKEDKSIVTASIDNSSSKEEEFQKCSFCKSLIKLGNCPVKDHLSGRFIETDLLSRPIKRKQVISESSSDATNKRQKTNFVTPVVSQTFSGNIPNLSNHSKPFPAKRSGSVFCSYCKALKKKPKCQNPRHLDGLPLQLPSCNDFSIVGGSRLCPYCQSLRKSCRDERHVDGHYFRVDTSSPTNISKVTGSTNATRANGFEEDRLKEGENKVKQKYLEHHQHRNQDSAESMAARMVPLGKQNRTPMERLRESTMSSVGVFGPPPEKHVPPDKDAKPKKSSLKTVVSTFQATDLSPTLDVSSGKRKVQFADEGSVRRSLVQCIYYSPEPASSPLSSTSNLW